MAFGFWLLAGCRSLEPDDDTVTSVELPVVDARSSLALRIGDMSQTERLQRDRKSKRVWLEPTSFHGLSGCAPALVKGKCILKPDRVEVLFARGVGRRR